MSLFADRLERFGDRLALVTQAGLKLTYGELAAKADEFAQSIGKERKLLIVETLNEIPPLVAYLGALRGRHPVILAGDGSSDADARIAETFQPYAIFKRVDGNWELSVQHPDSATALHEDLAVLLSTSGSTGSPKLVRLSRENVASNADAIADYLELDDASHPITSLPFHYSYGMSIINSHLAVGATLLLTDESVTSSKFWSFFREQQATSLAGVPYTYDLLERMGLRDWELPSLKQLTQAGGRLAPEKVKAYASWARERGVKFYVMYGQTEAAPRMAYVPPERLLDNSDCIGVPVPGGAFKIIGDDGAEVSQPNEVGELVYRGPNVMLGYALCKEDLALGREVSELHTGDLACRTEGGLYRIAGRKSRFSKLFGLRLSLDDIEAFLAREGIEAVVAGDDDRIVLCVLKAASSPKLAELVAGQYGLTPSAIAVVERSEFPRLPSSKIDYRAVLAEVAAKEGKKRAVGRAKGKPGASLRESFGWALGRPDISAEDTFVGLGGDSLSYVEVSLAIERALGYLPDGWEEMPIGEIEKLGVQRPLISTLPTDIVLRFVAIMGVIIGHASGFSILGGSEVLLIIAGYSLARFQRHRLLEGGVWQVNLRYLVNFVLIYYAIVVGHEILFGDGINLNEMVWIAIVNYEPGSLAYLWFIQVLFKSIFFFSLPFFIPAFRAGVRSFPWLSAVLMIAGAIALHFISAHVNIPGIYNNYTPERMFLVVFGWGLFLTQSRSQKLVMMAAAIFIAAAIYIPAPLGLSRAIWVLCAVPLILWTRRVPMPASLLGPISAVASASFYIYLMQIIPLVELGLDGAHWWRIPDITGQSIALGLAVWFGVRVISRMRANIRLPAFNLRWGR